MLRFIVTALCGLVPVIVNGCSGRPWSQAVPKGLKITDLAPATASRAQTQTAKYTEILISFFELSEAQFASSQKPWNLLSTEAPQPAWPQVFQANGFAAGLGNEQTWAPVSELLRQSNSRMVSNVSLLMFDEKPRDVVAAPLQGQQTVFYKDSGGRIVSVTLRRGVPVLRLSASAVHGASGVCRLAVQPVFKMEVLRDPTSGSPAKNGQNEVVFDCAKFEAVMYPGDFILLGPAQPADEQLTLKSLFFAGAPQRTVRMYLILCRRVAL